MRKDSSTTAAAPAPARRAAQYVRMSTEHQKYSTENQAEAIAAYAARRGLEIVRSYEDAGKSGLKLEGRSALQRLISDVRAGATDFEVVLVYDVSRWGRFQDADESAYYEFVCKEAGIAVQYCAEQFENDGSLSATIIKSMKRAMAGEYSRELSAKVFAGQCRLVGLGFRQGGSPGYGLRRQLIDETRAPKGLLAPGERKSLQTDRVVLVPGPREEIDTVRRIYRMFVVQRRSEQEIASILNAETRSPLQQSWTRGAVHRILTNETYIGNNVYNRRSYKLKQRRVANPPDMWVRAKAAFEAVVEPDWFEAAGRIIEDRSRRLSDEAMLDHLKSLLSAHGALSGMLIDETEDMPSSSAYRSRFGTLLRAYTLVGYDPRRDYRYVETNRRLRLLYPGVVADIVSGIGAAGGVVRPEGGNDILVVNEEFALSVVIARCARTEAGGRRWRLRFDASLRPDLSVAVRMDETNSAPLDYYLLPRAEMLARRTPLGDENGLDLDAFRFDTLSPLYSLCARHLLEAA